MWGFIDTSAEWVIQPQFEDARLFSNGLAAVKKDNLWGYIANPLIYEAWVSDEILRGSAIGLYEPPKSETGSMSELLEGVASLIEKIELKRYSNEELVSLLKLEDRPYNRDASQLSREDAAVIAAVTAEHLGANIYCLYGFLADEDRVDPAKLSYVNYAVSFGLFDFEEPGVFAPQNTMSSDELYRLITRLYETCIDIKQ